MRCSAFVLGQEGPCGDRAVFLGPFRKPLCERCASERKAAHEAGATILSIVQEAEHGRILPFVLVPIQVQDSLKQEEP